jgi:two-component system, OmpR family, sensor histidine kinase TctE
MIGAQRGGSLRRVLLLGILAPVLVFVGINSVSLYRQALEAADKAYDRTLLASAKSIGEQLAVEDVAGRARLRSTVPYSALEAFEADNRSRMYFKVAGFDGEMVSGYEDLPPWSGTLPSHNVYAALVHFYDASFRGAPVRMAVLLQPVAGQAGQGMATIQVAETLELRQALARELMVRTVWQQGALVVVIALVVLVVVERATRPVRELSAQLQTRAAGDLSPLSVMHAPREIQPVIEATNGLMQRLDHLLQHQKRFVRDTSHQLRTPLAVLRAQVQSARRGDVEPAQALREIEHTVADATDLANQMLALAKVEQLRQQDDAPVIDWAQTVRAVALDLSALIAQRRLDFDLSSTPAHVRAHEWALRELTRNLIDNAIKHSPEGAALRIRLLNDGRHAALTVADQGTGVPGDLRPRLFQPFARADGAAPGGSGLGLAICHEIVASLSGQIELRNRDAGGQVQGLDAVVRLPLAASA